MRSTMEDIATAFDGPPEDQIATLEMFPVAEQYTLCWRHLAEIHAAPRWIMAPIGRRPRCKRLDRRGFSL